ncbi:MAG: hypothetical protein WCE54_06990, partial [Ignavibacteriaceae bacterium]
GAINVQNDSLIDFLNSKADTIQYPKIIIVSSTGQSSAYYTCLLRIYGLNNVYSLNFGMALWNRVFSDIWIEHAEDNEIQNHLDGSTLYPGNPQMKLPDIQVDLQSSDNQNTIKKLIKDIIIKGFDDQTYVSFTRHDTTFSGDKTIINFYFDGQSVNDYYIICVGSLRLYKALFISFFPTGHLPGAYFYFDKDFESSRNIQTIPTDRKIVVYSTSGQVSSFVTAYLRLIGYDAKSLLYGGNGYTYSRITNPEELNLFVPYVFLPDNIRDYPYISGISPK